ncbi:MAG: hypothetical protein IJ802_06425 [Kiritimatiellae bacterium]|nr:hypothetical protein [Kiritimatiellia bacterium]
MSKVHLRTFFALCAIFTGLTFLDGFVYAIWGAEILGHDASLSERLWVCAVDTMRYGFLLPPLAFVLGRFAKFVFVSAFCWILTVLAASWYSLFMFHTDFCEAFVPLVCATNPAEVMTFLRMQTDLVSIAFAFAFLAALAAGAIFIVRMEMPRPSLCGVAVWLAALIPFFGIRAFVHGCGRTVDTRLAYAKIVNSIRFADRSLAIVIAACDNPEVPDVEQSTITTNGGGIAFL